MESFCGPGSRRTVHDDDRCTEFYPAHYWPGETALDHLKFSLKHEPLDLRIIVATLHRLPPAELCAWVAAAPTGKFTRQAWFLYEYFTGTRLDLPDIKVGAYVPALDPQRHITLGTRKSARHRVQNNLLGSRDLSIIVRRTERLESLMASDITGAVRELVRHYDPDLITRAVNFLYTKETRSSFAIEGERPTAQRAERFAAILRDAAAFDPTDKAQLIRHQGQIVDPRYAAKDWRDFQNFVGETATDFAERIHYICPRPQDVGRLMLGWQKLADRLLFLEHDIDPVVAAAVISFAFAFIHPFEDGNGRIHRFLIHNTLATHGVTPKGLIFPVSAAILRQKHEYDRVLARFSAPLFGVIDWSLEDGEMQVHHDTGPLYRYFDATAQAEFLYDRVIDTITNDLHEELGFLVVFDQAMAAMREIVDMPDRRLHLFFKICLQNAGKLSKAKRADFAELTDAEVAALENAITAARGES